jgi:tetratricopeptide (TPR) repeat protein
MGSKRSARRNRKNAQVASDVLSDPFFRADSLAPSALEARGESHDAASDVLAVEPRKWSPVAKARRARFAKYVTATVGACAVVCALAGIRHATGARSDAPSALANRDVPMRPPPAPPPPAPPAPETTDIEPPAAAPPSARFVEPTEDDRSLARREKRDSQRALELGHVAEAIERGEKSVADDPTDREAWLILGAAYQHASDPENARRCFQACLTQGKKGATWECAAMLR